MGCRQVCRFKVKKVRPIFGQNGHWNGNRVRKGWARVGRRPNTWVAKIEEFTKWKRWDNWQNVAVRNPALWEQSMLEFVQFAVGR